MTTQIDRNDATRLGHDPVLTARALTKRYGWRTVLNRIDLTVHAGECLAILGPNGAGKTTLLRLLVGLVRPTAGSIEWFGRPAGDFGPAVRAQLGVVMHRMMLDPELTVAENLRYYARLYGVIDAAERIRALGEELGLTDRLGDRVRSLSRGFQQRAALARALLHRPRVLLLDEPDTGLDIASRIRLVDLVERFCADGGTVLMTTHAPELAIQLAQRAIYLEHGRIVWSARGRDELDLYLRIQPRLVTV